MHHSTKRQKQAEVLRLFRKVHRTTGAALFILFLFISLTGLILGWKKNSGGVILAKTHTGTSTNLKAWLPLDSLHQIACTVLHDSVSPDLSTALDRIDIRKEKGMAKFVFVDQYWGIQLDGTTGHVLHIERRRADFIENIHDGSILDRYLNTGNIIKLLYTTISGVALFVFTITGFWLWYGPKRMRRSSASKSSQG